ncbi:hypothetical protein AAVH_38847, partial [Aphelenchoides avenae]
MSDVASDTYFLGDFTPEEYVNATYTKAGEIMQPLMATFASKENTTTQKEVAMVRKLQLTLVDLLLDLMWYLSKVVNRLPKPFGEGSSGYLEIMPNSTQELWKPYLRHNLGVWRFGILENLREHFEGGGQNLTTLNTSTYYISETFIKDLREVSDMIAPGCENRSADTSTYEGEKIS